MVWLYLLKEFLSRSVCRYIHSLSRFNQTPVIVNNGSLEKFYIQNYRQDVVSVNWVEINSIQSANDNWSFFRDSFTLILTNMSLWKNSSSHIFIYFLVLPFPVDLIHYCLRVPRWNKVKAIEKDYNTSMKW